MANTVWELKSTSCYHHLQRQHRSSGLCKYSWGIFTEGDVGSAGGSGYGAYLAHHMRLHRSNCTRFIYAPSLIPFLPALDGDAFHQQFQHIDQYLLGDLFGFRVGA